MEQHIQALVALARVNRHAILITAQVTPVPLGRCMSVNLISMQRRTFLDHAHHRQVRRIRLQVQIVCSA